MKTKRVKQIDWDFSVLGFGCWGASGNGTWTDHDDDEQVKAIQKAIELGINFFDVAPIYGFGHAEKILGKAIKGNRDKIFIATKAGIPWTEDFSAGNNVTAESLKKEIDESLERLQVDYVDLLQVHWPSSKGVPLEETITAMKEIQASGKAKYIGLSNYSVEDLEKASEITNIVSMQALYNILEQNADSYHNIPLQYRVSNEVLPAVKEKGMAFFPYSPLFQGLLSGKIKNDTTFGDNDVRNSNPKLNKEERQKHLKIIDEIMKIDELKDKKLSEVAINYLVAKDEVTSVIATQANISEVEANVRALEWEMSKDTVNTIDKIVQENL